MQKNMKKLTFASISDTTKTELEIFVGKKGPHSLFCIASKCVSTVRTKFSFFLMCLSEQSQTV